MKNATASTMSMTMRMSMRMLWVKSLAEISI
jgi:hypothetical protein